MGGDSGRVVRVKVTGCKGGDGGGLVSELQARKWCQGRPLGIGSRDRVCKRGSVKKGSREGG